MDEHKKSTPVKPMIVISVYDENTDELIAKRETYSVETAEQILADVQGWIDRYVKENKFQCLQCNYWFDDDDMEDKPDGQKVCQDCLEKLINGNEQLNT